MRGIRSFRARGGSSHADSSECARELCGACVVALGCDCERSGAGAGTPAAATSLLLLPRPFRLPAAAWAPRDEAPADETSDHDKLAGHFGVGYFGISQIPYAGGLAGGNIAVANVTAPVVGVRYWMTRQLGIDVGAGLSLSTFSNSQTPAPNPAPQNPPTVFAFALHAGVPIALASAKHFTFEIVPEATFGYATTSLNGHQLNVRCTACASTSAGASAARSTSASWACRSSRSKPASVSSCATRTSAPRRTPTRPWGGAPSRRRRPRAPTLGTSVGSDPWAIFTDNISALYYF